MTVEPLGRQAARRSSPVEAVAMMDPAASRVAATTRVAAVASSEVG
jgi:hypothetical protein